MDNNFKISTKIISKEEILNFYSNMDNFYKSIIEFLYTGNCNPSITHQEISVKKYDKSALGNWNNNAGIYIFIENNFPVYIGKAGTGESSVFLDRISQELTCYGPDSKNPNRTENPTNTLSRNIQNIESLLQNRAVNGDESLKIINNCSIIFIKSGAKGDNNSATALESILISLFHPRYNK